MSIYSGLKIDFTSFNLELYYNTHVIECHSPNDTTLYDLSGNGNNGTFANPSFGNDGFVDNTIYYDGTGTGDGTADGSRVDFPSAAVTSNPTVAPNGRTILWVAKPDDTARRALLYGSTTINHLEQFSSTSFRTEAKLQNGYSFGATNANITANKYDMFAIVFNNDETSPTAKWYQNGISFYEKSMINGSAAHDYFEPNAIGRETGTTSYTYSPSYKGYIPIFISYKNTLSDEEIKFLYLQFKTKYNL